MLNIKKEALCRKKASSSFRKAGESEIGEGEGRQCSKIIFIEPPGLKLNDTCYKESVRLDAISNYGEEENHGNPNRDFPFILTVKSCESETVSH